MKSTRSWTTAAVGAVLWAGLVAAGLAGSPDALHAQDDYDVPYVPTPDQVMSQMLNILEPTSEDTLFDLGSGDGRIVIAAADRHGVHGVGVEIDSGRVALSRENAASAGVDDRVRFIHGDLFDADLSSATMITLYLLPNVNLRLRPKLYEELRPGTEVVSHDFDMDEWEPDSTVKVPDDGSRVFYWVIPADASGKWEVTAAGEPFTLWVDQQFQELDAEASGLPGVEVRSASLRGRSIRIELEAPEGSALDGLVLEGTVEGDRMSGRAGSGRSWSARRVADGAPVTTG